MKLSYILFVLLSGLMAFFVGGALGILYKSINNSETITIPIYLQSKYNDAYMECHITTTTSNTRMYEYRGNIDENNTFCVMVRGLKTHTKFEEVENNE